MAIPALGPSFGVAPSGTCICKSYRLYISELSTFIPSSLSLALLGIKSCKIGKSPLSISFFTTECAIRTDSFITSPRLPVSCKAPLPLIFIASIVSTSPPTAVHARPLTTPI